METRVGNTPDVAEPAVITQAPAEPAILDPPGNGAETCEPATSPKEEGYFLGQSLAVSLKAKAREAAGASGDKRQHAAFLDGLRAGLGALLETPTATADDEPKRAGLVAGLRQALRPYNASYRAEAINGLLDTLKEKGDLEGLYTNHFTMVHILRPIARVRLSPDVIKAGLETVLADARNVLDPADELKTMEPAVRAVIDRLDAKVKTIVGILLDLNWLDGLAIGVDFGKVVLNEKLCDPENIEQGLKDFADDVDVQTMARAYTLANSIQDAAHGRN